MVNSLRQLTYVAMKLFRLPKSSHQMEIIDFYEHNIMDCFYKTFLNLKHVLDKNIKCKILPEQ